MKPFDPRLLKAAGQTRYFLAATVAIALVATVGTLVVAFALSQFVVEVFVNGLDVNAASHWLVFAVIAALVRGVAHFLGEIFGYGTSRGIKAQFRTQALDSIARDPAHKDAGSLSQLIGPGLDALDGYFGKFLPQLVFSVVVTPIFILVIFLNDPISAVSIVLTLPLIPIFMILIGLVTKDVQDAQLRASTALSAHFLEVLRGITTLKIFDRIGRQVEVLNEVSQEQKRRTMKVLRLSFLSGFALELAASLSVALIAVQIGLRLVDGAMLLSVGLFVLLLAPEVYLPLRNVGVQFHNSQAGVAATSQLLDLLEGQVSEPGDKLQIAVGITVLTGPSGSGKTTALRTLVGPDAAYVPQDVQLLTGSVLDNVAGFENQDPSLVTSLLEQLNLGELRLDYQIAGSQGLSGGQAQRLMIARALYRLKTQNLKLLLLDEPASMLDEQNQLLVANLLHELRTRGVWIVIATHQQALMALADRNLSLGGMNV